VRNEEFWNCKINHTLSVAGCDTARVAGVTLPEREYKDR